MPASVQGSRAFGAASLGLTRQARTTTLEQLDPHMLLLRLTPAPCRTACSCSEYDQSMRPGWVASTKINSPVRPVFLACLPGCNLLVVPTLPPALSPLLQSVLGRESQHLRVSWLLSMGCGPKDYLPAISHVPSSRSSSKNGASSCGGMMGARVEGDAAQSMDSSHQAATRQAGTPSQSNRLPQPETPACETPADNAKAATPGQMPLSEKLVMSLRCVGG